MPAYKWDFTAAGSGDAMKMATALDKMDRSAKSLTPALNTLTATLDALTLALKPMGEAFTKAAEGVNTFKKAIQPLIRYTEKHKEGFKTLSAASATLTRATQAMTGAVTQQSNVVQNNQKYVGSTVTVINNYERAVNSATGAGKRFHGGLLETLGAWNTINKAADFAVKRYQQVKSAMTSVFRNTQQYGGGFEAAERQLGVFMGAGQSPEARKQFEDVVKVAEKTAQDTTVGGADALQAAISASKAGMQRGDLAKALPTIINASIAEGMDAARIAEIGAITSSQFQRTGLGKGDDGKKIAADASGSIKILQATAAASSTDINQLFESMKNSASGATMLGMQLDEVAATLAVLSQNGETGGRAGTRLMMAFSRMATQTPQATEAMKKLGVTFKDATTGDVKPFTQILDELKTKLAGVQGNAQKMDYLKKIFGESFSSMAFLVEQGGDAIKNAMQDIKNSMNIGDELQQENMAGMAGALEAYKGSYEQVYVSLRRVLTVPISNYWLTLAEALNAVSSRFSELGKAFSDAKTVDEWLNVLQNTDFSNIFQGLAAEFSKEIEVLKKLASGIWTLIKSGFQAVWKEIDSEKVLASVTSSFGRAGGALFKSLFTTENMAAATKFGVELGKQIISGLSESTTGMMALALGGATMGGDLLTKTSGRFMGEKSAAINSGVMKLQSIVVGSIIAGELINQAVNAYFGGKNAEQDARGVRETNALLTKLYVSLGKTDDQTKRASLLQSISVQEEELKKQTGSYSEMKAQREKWQADRAAKASAATPEGKMQAAGMTQEQIQRAMGWGKEAKSAGSREKWLESTTTWDKETRIAQLQALDPMVSRRMAESQASREETAFKTAEYGRWAKGEQDKYREYQRLGMKPKNQYSRVIEEAAPQTQEEIDAALKRLSIEKEIFDLKKKESETQAQIANAPIDLKMQQNETNANFSKWLLEPINKFTEAISGVIGKFMGIFEGLGNKRVEAGQKSGRLDEAGAKKESADVLEGSVERAQKMLKLAQTPGQKAEALQTQADKLLELSDVTGDKSKAAQADELLKRAQAEQGKQEDIELKKVELDRKLAQDNVKLLESKKDGSASESVARLQQLFESYSELGDVQGAAKTKEALQTAQREAAGESVKWLKMIFEELKLGRKSNELAIKDEAAKSQQTAQQTTQQVVSAVQNSGSGFNPALMQPAF